MHFSKIATQLHALSFNSQSCVTISENFKSTGRTDTKLRNSVAVIEFEAGLTCTGICGTVSDVMGDWPPPGESASELFCDINVGCYGHITTAYSWTAGRLLCQQAGGDLASLDTEEKMSFVCARFS